MPMGNEQKRCVCRKETQGLNQGEERNEQRISMSVVDGRSVGDKEKTASQQQ